VRTHSDSTARRFRAAIEQALELTGPSAELYSELALQTARRSGMWKRPPDREVVDEWIDRALELAEEDSPTNARALAAVALWRKDEAAARSLHAIAQRLGRRRAPLERARGPHRRRMECRRPGAGAHVAGGTVSNYSRVSSILMTDISRS